MPREALSAMAGRRGQGQVGEVGTPPRRSSAHNPWFGRAAQVLPGHPCRPHAPAQHGSTDAGGHLLHAWFMLGQLRCGMEGRRGRVVGRSAPLVGGAAGLMRRQHPALRCVAGLPSCPPGTPRVVHPALGLAGAASVELRGSHGAGTGLAGLDGRRRRAGRLRARVVLDAAPQLVCRVWCAVAGRVAAQAGVAGSRGRCSCRVCRLPSAHPAPGSPSPPHPRSRPGMTGPATGCTPGSWRGRSCRGAGPGRRPTHAQHVLAPPPSSPAGLPTPLTCRTGRCWPC